MPTIERIYAKIVKEGVVRGFAVVPEFLVRVHPDGPSKKIDLVWLIQRNNETLTGSCRDWLIAAAFEIEGCNVPLSRLKQHEGQFQQLQSIQENGFSFFVVLYTEARHRKDPRWQVSDPERCVTKRIRSKRCKDNVFAVLDGGTADWDCMPGLPHNTPAQ